METLSVGMFVRTKRDGIGKIISLSIGEEDECCFIELSKRRTGIKEHNILKASHNIKELLQVGDIITYEFPTGLGMLKFENVTILGNFLDVLKSSDEYKIISIVTKEQFESMSYKVGE